MSGLAQRAAHGAAWVALGNVVKALVQFIPIAALTRIIAPDAFGVFTIVMVVIYVAELISFGGVGPSIVQHRVLKPVTVGAAIWIAAGVSVIVAVVIIASRGAFADFMHMPGLAAPLLFVALGFPVNGLSVVGARLLQRDINVRLLTLIDIGSYIVGYYLVGIPMAWLGYGIWSLVAAFLTQSVLRAASLAFSVRRELTLITDRPSLIEMARSSLPLMSANLLLELQFNLDRLIVGRVLGASPVGFYGRASDLIVRGNRLFDQILTRVFFPAFSRKQDDKERLRELLPLISAAMLLLMAPFSLFMFGFAPEIIRIAFGPGWSQAETPFALLSLMLTFTVIARLQMMLIQGMGLYGLALWIELGAAVVVFTGAMLGSRQGLAGVAVAMLVAFLSKAVVTQVVTARLLQIPMRALAKALAQALPMIVIAAVALWGAEQLAALFAPPVARVAVGLAVFLAICVAVALPTRGATLLPLMTLKRIVRG
ncbi:oligosaccharide flippase family protein [Sinirhodobacter huangdaonensis]|uniref:oligosaccharide flippase family protein n=1 Tax=Paenirhodobacter huangdaonensis TaxID=2501515 RepID=UPI0013E3AE0C|nr:oligosaccharide flippase family protein [Sinirhodobacter huangdaonensis]